MITATVHDTQIQIDWTETASCGWCGVPIKTEWGANGAKGGPGKGKAALERVDEEICKHSAEARWLSHGIGEEGRGYCPS